ncbi:MAG: pyridoxamine 5'-phosphate oxidase family protein [Actinobacteria bacterium]|nr:pyridoxamine 5'-phosphate oxidase family protein [Actinomycetota bacterium]
MSREPDGPESNPAGWPGELLPLFRDAATAEFASLTRDGRPVTWPLTPYVGEDGGTLDVSTGLAYPAKAERVRRDPRVALLFSDPSGSGLSSPPVALVLGLATVRDGDLQGAADRYARLSMLKLPAAWRWSPSFLIRRQRWYFARIWILVTPLRILWWPDGDTSLPPREWLAPPGTAAPPSDPSPAGGQPPPWRERPSDWRLRAARAVAGLGPPVLTVLGDDGLPVPFRARRAWADPDGFRLRMPEGWPGWPGRPEGPACCTYHLHPELFVGQENAAFVGTVEPAGRRGDVRFVVDRLLGDFSLPGSRLRRSLAFLGAGRRLQPRLRREAERRGQPVPKVNLPSRAERAAALREQRARARARARGRGPDRTG